jgi:hypothetical protein
MALIVCTAGCVAGAQLSLQRPVKKQCDSAGLDACERLTRGTVLYADGQALEGQRALASGLQANIGRNAQLERFAAGLSALGSAPQTSEYAVRLQPAIEMILNAAGNGPASQAVWTRPAVASASAQTPPTGQPQPSEAHSDTRAETTDESSSASSASSSGPRREISGFIGGHAGVTGKTNIVPCRLGDGTPAWCILQPILMRGYITDLVVSQACEREVFVLEGSPARPSWLMWSGANRGLSAHDLRLPVQSGGTLVAGVVTKGSDTSSQWLWRCGVNWTQTAGR